MARHQTYSSAMPTFVTQTTPNPNSLKITSNDGPFITGGMISCSSQQEATESPLAQRILGLGEVENVFILPQFLTITKSPSGDWPSLLIRVEAILEEHFAAPDGNHLTPLGRSDN